MEGRIDLVNYSPCMQIFERSTYFDAVATEIIDNILYYCRLRVVLTSCAGRPPQYAPAPCDLDL